MLTITEAAEEKIAELISESEKPVKGLRIGARLDAAQQVDYKLAFVSDEQLDDGAFEAREASFVERSER